MNTTLGGQGKPMRAHRWLFVVLLLTVAPAAANVGPPWLFVGFGATWVVPIILGLIEGGLLQRMITISNRRAAGLMIAANYISAIFGWATLGLLNLGLSTLPSRLVYLHFLPVLVAVIVLAFFVTVLVEWPFHRRSHGAVDAAWRKGWATCVRVNAVTYLVVAFCFWSLTGIGLVKRAKPVADTSFAASVPGWVYYTSGGELRRIRLGGDGDERVQTLAGEWAAWNRNLMQPQPRLAVLPDPETGELGLWIGSRDRQPARLLQKLPGQVAVFGADEERFGDFWTLNRAADLRPGDEHEWEFLTGFWAEEGLEARSESRSISFQLGTPILMAYARYATVLPGDLVVWQLGSQIAVLDFPNRRWSILVEGIGPVVVLDP